MVASNPRVKAKIHVRFTNETKKPILFHHSDLPQWETGARRWRCSRDGLRNSCHQSQKLQQAEWDFSQTKMEEELKTEGQNCWRLVGATAARGRFQLVEDMQNSNSSCV